MRKTRVTNKPQGETKIAFIEAKGETKHKPCELTFAGETLELGEVVLNVVNAYYNEVCRDGDLKELFLKELLDIVEVDIVDWDDEDSDKPLTLYS